MATVLYNFGNIKDIFTKLTLIFFQPTSKNEYRQEWIYRGEGNANLVISLPNKRQILRIQKTYKSKPFFMWLVDLVSDYLTVDTSCDPTQECQDLKFYRAVMMPLLGSFVCEAMQIQISRKQTNDLNRALTQCRPSYRKHKKLKFGTATFFTDFAFLPQRMDSFRLHGATYAIEIKPKQGWLPKRSRQTKCKFCQNQYLKLAQGQIKKISGYCPLDLFSGDKNRMIKAIKSLIYNPQNNFKIFRNGVLIYGDHTSIDVFYDLLKEWMHCPDSLSTYRLLEEFSELIYDSLLKPIDNKRTDHNCEEVLSVKCDSFSDSNSCVYPEENLLPEGCILERILAVQKFDQLGLDFYKRMAEERKLDRTSDYVSELLDEIEKRNCAKCVLNNSINKCVRGNNVDSSENLLDFVPYLVASVANDCSFMLTFRKIKETNVTTLDDRHVIATKNGMFVINVGVFDLFPKPLSTIEKHCNRRTKMSLLSQSPP